MATYKLIGNDYKYDYFCTSGGDIFYNDDKDKTEYPIFGLASREVDERHDGKLTKYVSVPLMHKDGGRTPAADAGEMIARSIFRIGLAVPGYVRLKDKDLYNIHIDNLEFVEISQHTGDIVAVWNKNGRTSVREEYESVECACYNPGDTVAQTSPTVEGETNSVKMDLPERDRSLVASALYHLIHDKGFTAHEALDTLMLDNNSDALALYLEGERAVKDKYIEARNQSLKGSVSILSQEEREDTSFIETGATWRGHKVYLNPQDGKTYYKDNADGKYKD